MIRFYFDSKTFFKYQKYTSSMDLMKKLYDVKTKEDKRKNIIVVIANQSTEQVATLKEIFPDIFKFSDIQLFSCNEGCLKSNALLEKAISMCPEKSYFVSFVVDTAKQPAPLSKDEKVNPLVRGHKIERVTPKQAENCLVAYGAMNSEIGF
jgi:hypothetical protein